MQSKIGELLLKFKVEKNSKPPKKGKTTPTQEIIRRVGYPPLE